MEARLFQNQNSNWTPLTFQIIAQIDNMSNSLLLQVILNGVDAWTGLAAQWLKFKASMLCRITWRNRGKVNVTDGI